MEIEKICVLGAGTMGRGIGVYRYDEDGNRLPGGEQEGPGGAR